MVARGKGKGGGKEREKNKGRPRLRSSPSSPHVVGLIQAMNVPAGGIKNAGSVGSEVGTYSASKTSVSASAEAQ